MTIPVLIDMKKMIPKTIKEPIAIPISFEASKNHLKSRCDNVTRRDGDGVFIETWHHYYSDDSLSS